MSRPSTAAQLPAIANRKAAIKIAAMSENRNNSPSSDPVMIVGATIYISTIVVGVLALIAGDLLNFEAWQTVMYDEAGKVTSRAHDPTGVLRNLGLFALGILAFGLAAWRTITAHRQAETANKQLALATRGDVASRFQKGVEMLDSAEEPVRIAGLLILRDASLEAPSSFVRAGCEIAAAFAARRTIIRRDERAEAAALSSSRQNLDKDVAVALKALIRLLPASREQDISFRVSLEEMFLDSTNLTGFDFSHIDFLNCSVSGSLIADCKFIDCSIVSSEMVGCFVISSSFIDTEISMVPLRRTRFFTTAFHNGSVADSDLEGVSFRQCTLEKTRFLEADVSSVEVSSPNFRLEETSRVYAKTGKVPNPFPIEVEEREPLDF